jgi:hypothetical protein
MLRKRVREKSRPIKFIEDKIKKKVIHTFPDYYEPKATTIYYAKCVVGE